MCVGFAADLVVSGGFASVNGASDSHMTMTYWSLCGFSTEAELTETDSLETHIKELS